MTLNGHPNLSRQAGAGVAARVLYLARRKIESMNTLSASVEELRDQTLQLL